MDQAEPDGGPAVISELRADPWSFPPDLIRFTFEGFKYGAILGGIYGLVAALTDFPRFFLQEYGWVFVPFGALLGVFYGLVATLLAWPFGKALVRSGLIRRKGLGLGLGMVVFAGAVLALAWLWSVDPIDLIPLIAVPAGAASITAVLVGLRYDARNRREFRDLP